MMLCVVNMIETLLNWKILSISLIIDRIKQVRYLSVSTFQKELLEIMSGDVKYNEISPIMGDLPVAPRD